MELEKKRTVQTEPEGEVELCVLCGQHTKVRKDTPIKERKYYVETAGQLCEDCYAELYFVSHNDNILKF